MVSVTALTSVTAFKTRPGYRVTYDELNSRLAMEVNIIMPLILVYDEALLNF